MIKLLSILREIHLVPENKVWVKLKQFKEEDVVKYQTYQYQKWWEKGKITAIRRFKQGVHIVILPHDSIYHYTIVVWLEMDYESQQTAFITLEHDTDQ